MTEDEYLLLSSFHENLLANRPFSWDIYDWQRIRFIFGHYFSEKTLVYLPSKGPRDNFLFTIVRNPKDRIRSLFSHNFRKFGVSVPAGFDVSSFSSSFCDEILRAFPSLVVSSIPKWQSALSILTCFDYLASTERYAEHIPHIYRKLELDLDEIDLSERDNEAGGQYVDFPTEFDSTEFDLSDDMLLYKAIRPYIGRESFGNSLSDGLGIPSLKLQLWSNVANWDRSKVVEELSEDYLTYAAYEYHLIGTEKRTAMTDHLKARVLNLLRLSERMEKNDF